MTPIDSDVHWMKRALRLAARGYTPPNPMVGCVIVKDGTVVGEGFHLAAGLPHAEVNALSRAGESAHGATVYVTLEPCRHWGRTPPCADALVAARVKRVVVAQEDPDPRVRGMGIQQLRNQGIVVNVGLLSAEAKRLNRHFNFFHTAHSPYITLKAAITLDGKIATITGDSKWISSQRSRAYIHKIRARSGAVMVGIGTVLADDPELTARLSPAPPRQPLRIIVDSRLRTPPTCRAIQVSSSQAPLLIVTTDMVSDLAGQAITREGVELLRLPAFDGRVDLRKMAEALTNRQVTSVFVEGGGQLNAALLSAGLIQSVLFFVAPLIFGGQNAPTAIEGDGVKVVADAIRLYNMAVRRLEQDVVLEADVQTIARANSRE